MLRCATKDSRHHDSIAHKEVRPGRIATRHLTDSLNEDPTVGVSLESPGAKFKAINTGTFLPKLISNVCCNLKLSEFIDYK